METKQSIRKTIFQRRREADPVRLKEDSQIICQNVCELPAFAAADWIYVYIDCKREVMTNRLIEMAFLMGKRVAAPRVEGQEMRFYEITSLEQLEKGSFGILEPAASCPLVEGRPGLMVMPGVAFDRKRHRIGYGGGFYDRYLSCHTDLYKVGIAFEFQIVDQVPFESTDRIPDLLITEAGIYQ